jgi:hypothetical protein
MLIPHALVIPGDIPFVGMDVLPARRIDMGIIRVLAKVPWRRMFRYLPGAIGIAGELMTQRADKAQTDVLKRLEEQQMDMANALELIAVRLKFVFWVAIVALVAAAAALVVSMLR